MSTQIYLHKHNIEVRYKNRYKKRGRVYYSTRITINVPVGLQVSKVRQVPEGELSTAFYSVIEGVMFASCSNLLFGFEVTENL